MASSLVPTSEESNELVILVMHTDFATYVQSRDQEINSFFKQLNPKPDFLLLQEVKVTTLKNRQEPFDQRVAVKNALGDYRATDGTRKSYSWFWGEGSLHIPKNEGFERIVSYNMIMYKEEHGGTQIRSNGKRYCIGQFTFRRKKILLVSFHGNKNLDTEDLELKTDTRFKDITEVNQIKAIKQYRLGKYLEIFHKLKVYNNCQHLIVGGDFNLNIDKLLVLDKIKAKKPTQGQKLLKQRQAEFIQLFNRLDLQIEYKHHRNGKNKFDALVCDKGLSNDIKVTVYCNKSEETVGDTSIKNVPFSQYTLDHHPLLFTIKIAALPALVQAPPPEDLDALPKTKKNRKGNGNESKQVQDDLTEERDETENIEEVTKSQQEKVEPEKSKKSIKKVEPEKSKKSIADTGLKKELTAEERAKRLEDWKKEIENFLKKLTLPEHLTKEQREESAADITVVLMNVGNSEKSTENTIVSAKNQPEITSVNSSEKLSENLPENLPEISSEQLTGNTKKNPPKLLIFYQEGSPEKDAHITATLGDSNYLIFSSKDGNVKTYGIIYHKASDLKNPT
jgi:hypothetical protein